MRVLVISEHYFPIKGGSTTYVHNLCNSLSEIGCEVFLVTMPDDRNSILEWRREGNLYVYRLKIPKFLRKERYFPIFLRKNLKKMIEEVAPNIIHFAHGFFAPLITKLYSRDITMPIVWTVHNIPPYEHTLSYFNRVKPLHSLLEKIYFSAADLYGRFVLRVADYNHLICVSEKTARLVIERGGAIHKVRVINEGVDTTFFSKLDNVSRIKERIKIQNRWPIISTVAGIAPHKGLDYLIKTAPKIIEKYPDALFIIVGPVRFEGYFSSLKEMIAKLRIEDKAKIITDAPSSEIVEYYNIADVYVQPSLEEGFCISILEAMACGKPVIGTKTGAIPKFISESRGGILIEPASSEQIYEAIVKLLADSTEMEKMSLRSRDYVVKNYSWNKIARDTLELYKSLL